jgi:hypothetical protein
MDQDEHEPQGKAVASLSADVSVTAPKAMDPPACVHVNGTHCHCGPGLGRAGHLPAGSHS